jgi:hypothetical protein
MAEPVKESYERIEARLEKAKQVFREQEANRQRLVEKCITLEVRANKAELLVQGAQALLTGDAGVPNLDPGDCTHPDPQHPLLVNAEEAGAYWARELTYKRRWQECIAALNTVHRLIGKLPKTPGEYAESIGDKQDWSRVVAQIQTIITEHVEIG